ncbi:hypothetical protein G9A89_019511 [Geosiphon pyriformis]|nr:hypothetical protein G9A89_019511 [Geosiphon pyriformis]
MAQLNITQTQINAFENLCQQIDDSFIERYPLNASPELNTVTNSKKLETFRDYVHANPRVANFYKEQHEKQTVESVRKQRAHFEKLDKGRMGIWEALEVLNELFDESDPDTELSQIEHCLQTAEALRRDGRPRWLILVGLIHDLGKLLMFYGAEGQWCIVGDIFPVGCKFSSKIIYPEFFKNNPDSNDPRYNTLYGIYEPNCGLDEVLMSFGHDEYIYQVVKKYLPPEACYVLRYHSFYAQHRENAYEHLMTDFDHEMMKWVKIFNPYDLYSKNDKPPNIEKLKPYYQELIEDFFPEVIHW